MFVDRWEEFYLKTSLYQFLWLTSNSMFKKVRKEERERKREKRGDTTEKIKKERGRR